MKKNILAIAIATAVAAPAAMADAKIYGYFNGALEMANERGQQMDNRNSRVGIKGSQDLGNGLSAIYQFEAGLDIMSGDFNNADKGGMRNTFLGLNGGFGTVLFGKHDTPLRMIQPSDAFADGKYTGNNRSTFNGGGSIGEDRLDNVLAYISPNFEGFQFALAGSTMQSSDSSYQDLDVTYNTAGDSVDDVELVNVTVPGVQDKADITNAISASVSYGKKSDGLYLALGYTDVDFKNDADDKVGDRNNIRLTAQYRADGLTAYGMYNKTEVNGDDFSDVVTIGASYKVGDFTPKAKLAFVDYGDAAGTDTDGVNFAAGVDYNLGKNTKAFVEVAMLDKDAGGAIKKSNGKFDDTTVFSIGMNHKF